MKGIFLLALLVFPAVILSFSGDTSFVVRAEEDEVDADDDVDVEGEGEDTGVIDEGGEEDEDVTQTGASPDADTTILFTKPANNPQELPAGQVVEFLVGFLNRGKQDFVLETLEASFRYPLDFSFYIQNFTTFGFNRVVKPNEESTLSYSFLTPENFAGRPIGLNVHLNYRDGEGNLFGESVFNETISVVEVDEGLEFETFFLYLFLAAGLVLLLVAGQQLLTSVGKKRVTKKPAVETGTSSTDGVDYEWLPKEMLNALNKTSPKSSPRANKSNHTSPKAAKHGAKQNGAAKHQSPRQRKAKRAAGED